LHVWPLLLSHPNNLDAHLRSAHVTSKPLLETSETQNVLGDQPRVQSVENCPGFRMLSFASLYCLVLLAFALIIGTQSCIRKLM